MDANEAILEQQPPSQSGIERDDEDTLLLQRYVQEGDREAMGVLFRRFAEPAYRLACHYHVRDAEDAVQNAFVDMLRRAGHYRAGVSSVRAWFMGFVVNACRHAARSESRDDARHARAVRLQGGQVDKDVPLNMDPELQALVMRTVHKLPERYRVPVWLHYYEGLTAREVAATLKLSENTLRSQLSRGVEQLRTMLAASGCAVALPEISALLSALPAESTPASLSASIEAFVRSGTYPAVRAKRMGGSAGLTSRTLRNMAPVLWIGAGLALAAALFAANGGAPPPQAEPALPIAEAIPGAAPASEEALAAPIYEDEFEGPALDSFWENVSSPDAAKPGSIKGAFIERLNGRAALAMTARGEARNNPEFPKGGEVEVTTKAIPLRGGTVEIRIQDSYLGHLWLSEHPDLAKAEEYYELCMELLDDQDQVLYRNLTRRNTQKYWNTQFVNGQETRTSPMPAPRELPTQSEATPILFVLWVDAQGRMALQDVQGNRGECGKSNRPPKAIKFRMRAKAYPGHEACWYLDRISIRRLDAWPDLGVQEQQR